MNVNPKVSFIVSVYNDPRKLPCLLASLAVQTMQDFEVIVTDNSPQWEQASTIRALTYSSMVKHVRHMHTKALTCYHSAEIGARESRGDFLVFASDDGYYMPTFTEIMLKYAGIYNAELIACGMVYDHRLTGKYEVMQPRLHGDVLIDKTGFMLRRERFKEFPNKPDTDRPYGCDGELIRQLMAEGIHHWTIPDVLVVHN